MKSGFDELDAEIFRINGSQGQQIFNERNATYLQSVVENSIDMYEFPDEDFLLFQHFAHRQLVFPFIFHNTRNLVAISKQISTIQVVVYWQS